MSKSAHFSGISFGLNHYYVIFHLIISFVFLLTDFLFGVHSSDFTGFASYFITLLVLTFFVFWRSRIDLVVRIIPAINLIFTEYLFVQNPFSLELLVFWSSLVPIGVLITQGVRPATFWVFVYCLAFAINYFLFVQWFGQEFIVNQTIARNLIGGVLFLLGFLGCIYLLYNLLGNSFYQSVEKNKELINLKDTLEEKNETLGTYNAAMVELHKYPIDYEDHHALFLFIGEVIRDLIYVDRVSFWMVSKDRTELRLATSISSEEGYYDHQILKKTDFPSYFENFENDKFVNAQDIYDSPFDQILGVSYAESQNVIAKIDCPILLNQQPYAIISCEYESSTHEWTTEEGLIIQSMADFVALQFKNEHISELMDKLQKQNEALSKNGHSIENMNNELQTLNMKLQEANESLEETVIKRTEELLQQNNQLREYAYVNSHMLRVPLSSILGISSLLQIKAQGGNSELIDALHKSTNDLDRIVRMISKALESGSSLSRKDIDFIINERFKKV